MENLFSNFEITIPMTHIITLLVISVLFVLFGKFKTALFSNFTFVFFWLYQNNKYAYENISLSSIMNIAGRYTVITSFILFGIALLLFYEIFEVR